MSDQNAHSTINDNDKHYLSIRNLRKVYAKSETPAVDSINLTVKKSELVALLGPSGCGKTTTLRMVAGLLSPTSGHIVVANKNLVHTPVHKRGMGMVFQSYALFPHMTVIENVAFGLQMKRVPKSQARSQAAEALDMVQLGHLAVRKPAELSGGQQQRVALARALVIKPKLLLLDEPLSNLDAKLREAMRHEIKEIQRKSGTTTLFVTHDQDEALDMADKIAILNQGRVAQYAEPKEIYDHPASHFVANFVGSANFLKITIIRTPGNGKYIINSDEFGTFEVSGNPELGETAPSLLVRPHKLTVEKLDPTKALPGLASSTTGTIVDSSYTGNIQTFTVSTDGGTILLSEGLTASQNGLRLGDKVRVSFQPADAHLVSETRE